MKLLPTIGTSGVVTSYYVEHDHSIHPFFSPLWGHGLINSGTCKFIPVVKHGDAVVVTGFLDKTFGGSTVPQGTIKLFHVVSGLTICVLSQYWGVYVDSVRS